jgi:hypothetical protein
VISAKMASMSELNTLLGAEDVYDLLEIITVDAHNNSLMAKKD